MGADFIGALVWLPKDEKPDWKGGRQAIQKLEATPRQGWPEDYVSDWADLHETDAEALAELRQDLKCLQEHWDEGGRESGMVQILGHNILLTGGMSRGDAPTELMDCIDRLGAANVLQACGFNRDARDSAAIRSLTAEIEAAGKGPSDLDGLVHDAKGEEAAVINNEGLEAQVDYLTEAGTNVEWLRERLGSL